MRAVDVRRLRCHETVSDAVIVGSGVAGLSAALELAPRRVTLLTKTGLGDGSSRWAQGGVAAALGAGDSPELHARDTLAAGAELADPAVVAALTAAAPGSLRRLIQRGARFDRAAGGALALGREGAHSRRRILHARGDATGAEMVRALVTALSRAPQVDVRERVFALDLVLAGEWVIGVLALHPGGRVVFHRAPAVVLACGGFGQLYARTTNPPEATGDGLAMAARAGARLADLEMVQFHPTALAAGADPLPLVTEALRGEGAVLLDERGERFLADLHPAAELAPRDVVARAIREVQQRGGEVMLDAVRSVGEAFPRRFPTVYRACRRAGIDPRRRPIPVTPAAHYAMGGVAVDGDGRSSLAGLWACGEVASTGVHGANRLASNSLLEALVCGARVAADLGGLLLPAPGARLGSPEVVWREPEADGDGGPAEAWPAEARRAIRQAAWQHAGLIRDRPGLESALAELAAIARRLPPRPGETRNLATVGRLVAAAALAREESRGGHYRSDFPRPEPHLRRRAFWTWSGEEGFPLRPVPAVERAREIA